MRRVLIAYAPALVWAGVVAFIGGQNEIPGPRIDLPIDKLAHFSFYAVLGGLAARGWQRSGRRVGWWWPLLAVWLLGAWDESRQRELPGRSAEVADWVADATGALVAFLVMKAWAGKKARSGVGDESGVTDGVPEHPGGDAAP